MKNFYLWLIYFCLPFQVFTQPLADHNLHFDHLPSRWDEGLPLGNAILGSLVWQKDAQNIRLALDRADLWDTRPMENMDNSDLNYQWITEQVRLKNYGIVQEKLDKPYENQPGPTKLPGAALEFFLGKNKITHSELDISTGLATVEFESGLMFKTFVHANRREGWFRWEMKNSTAQNLPFYPKLVPPGYAESTFSPGSPDLEKLGYPMGGMVEKPGLTVYHQPGFGGFSYEVAVFTKMKNGGLEGVWSITSHFPKAIWAEKAEKTVKSASRRGFEKSFSESKKWWSAFWKKSAVRLPDPILDKQYHLENYKFGCLARPFAPAINLQGIWTADNGSLPPWKSDFHHDLNTEMSYWHALPANHADLAEGFLRFLRSNEKAHLAWTKRFFGTAGLNVPGVETLLGEPMGGWIQYACSPTTAAWLAHQFYQHWQFTRDEVFLKNDAFPFLKSVAVHLEELTRRPDSTKNLKRFLPISSSPEINDNTINAWFPATFTNYDLALTRFVFEKTAELAAVLGKSEEANFWKTAAAELPELAMTENFELKIAPDLPFEKSHRHFSHLMAIYPLGLLDWNGGENDQKIIKNSLAALEKHGSSEWNGYSFSWLACLAARNRDGELARKSLKIFQEAFISKNSFHVNGDQSGENYANSTGRPFTLEGNFGFAAGVLEMLLQSQNGRVVVFPAIPKDWTDVSFENLRAAGGFLISAEMNNGICQSVKIKSEKSIGGEILLPPGNWKITKRTGKGTGKFGGRFFIGGGGRLEFAQIE